MFNKKDGDGIIGDIVIAVVENPKWQLIFLLLMFALFILCLFLMGGKVVSDRPTSA